VFVNLSNHPSSLWSEQQLAAAKQYGEIVDMEFPFISPSIPDEGLERLVEEYHSRVLAYGKPVVMLQGEFVFTYRLVKRLKEDGIMVVASSTERVTSEQIEPDGTTTKVSQFEFVDFRSY